MKKKLIAGILLFSIIIPNVSVQATSDKYNKVITKDIIPIEEEQNDFIHMIRGSEFVPKVVRQQVKEYETLVKKTSSKFEVLLANEDMSFSYLDKADTYDEAVKKANAASENVDVLKSTPAVIDSQGAVTYATASIGRLWRKYTNEAAKKETNSFFYEDQNLQKAYTYLNDGYMSEAPIVQDAENETKVLISGYEGWLNKNLNRYGTTSTRDLQITPISQVTNPCFYFVENNILYHKITTSLDNPAAAQSTTMVGVAPDYLKQGMKYSSYDGKYFYSGNDFRESLTKLTEDLQNGTHKSAVNGDNPYYAYYKYLPFRTKTTHTTSEINSFIDSELSVKGYSNSKLKGIGQIVIDAQDKFGVNALLMLGVAINESAWGTSNNALNKNNLFGLNAQDNRPGDASIFTSVQDCVEDFAKNYISRGYADPSNFTYYGGFLGGKNVGANVKYAADPYWADKAVHYAFLADYRISNNKVNSMKDYNNYQLGIFEGINNVIDDSGNTLYNVASNPKTNNSSHVGSVIPFLYGSTELINGVECYEINPEVTMAVINGRFNGVYNWEEHGYVNKNNIRVINIGETRYDKVDFDKDGQVTIKELSLTADKYNLLKGDNGWDSTYDINKDNIVDIYDLVRVAVKIIDIN